MSGRALLVTPLGLRNLEQNVFGAYQRLRMLLEAAAEEFDHVDILSLAAPQQGVDGQAAGEVQRAWGIAARVIGGSWPTRRLRPWLLEQASWTLRYRSTYFFSGLDNPVNRSTLAQLTTPAPDLIVAHKLPAMELVHGATDAAIPVLFDIDDIEHVAIRRKAEQTARWRDRVFIRGMIPGIRRAERRALRRAARVLVCSDLDRDGMARELHASAESIVVVPNSCAIRERSAVTPAPVLLFVGTFSYQPNVEAIEFFLTQCWDRIRAAVPGASVRIVGRKPEEVPSHAQPPAGAQFAGFVPDIDSVYREARIVICPVLSGGGTRVKLVEAAAFGKPIVATSVGAEGLDFEDGVHALLRDQAIPFAEACIKLLRDDALCEHLGAGSHAHARRRFDRAAVRARVREALRACLGRPGTVTATA